MPTTAETIAQCCLTIGQLRVDLAEAYHAATSQAECIVLERVIRQVAEQENILHRLSTPFEQEG